MKVVDYLTTQKPPSLYVANSHPKGVYSYYNPGIDDPKRHYGFKPGLLGKSVSLGVDISNWEMFDDDWGLESKEVSPLGAELSLFDRPNEVERGRILEAHRLESILQQQISERMAPSHHDGPLHPNGEQKGSRQIEESKDLTSLSLDELIGNLKVHEMNTRKILEYVEEDDKKYNTATCLVAQHQMDICLRVDLEADEWIKDSGCSKHMTGNRKLFSSYKAYNGCNVIFGSNLHGNIIGKGQICDNKCRVTFCEHNSEITKDGKVICRGIRKKGLYVMKLEMKPKDKICRATILMKLHVAWHRRISHANMRLNKSLASKK
ncbi:retrovirus-related pol polyprotein from transposon TNT 1-94 [Tanacetum coccineum]